MCFVVYIRGRVFYRVIHTGVAALGSCGTKIQDYGNLKPGPFPISRKRTTWYLAQCLMEPKIAFRRENPFYGASKWSVSAESISNFRRKGWESGKIEARFPGRSWPLETETFELFPVTLRATSSWVEPAKYIEEDNAESDYLY